MKVGILTYHCSYNFGANLQALALQSVLQKKGIPCEIVNYREPHKMAWYAEITRPEQAAAHEAFMRRYFVLGPVLTKPEEVESYCLEHLDAVLVGSDAVFRLVGKYNPRRLLRVLLGRDGGLANPAEMDEVSPYWMNWRRRPDGRAIPRASIAASAEATAYYYANPRLFPTIYRCIRAFDFLSVRDDWAAGMIRTLSLGTRTPALCPDPVFALNGAFAIPADEHPPQNLSKTILLGAKFEPAWRARFVEAAHARGFQVSNLPNPDRPFDFPEADFTIPLPLSPLAWFGLFARAAGFVGIRFHALVSCLTNGTPAVALDNTGAFQGNYARRSKVYDLCRRAGVLERYSTVVAAGRTDPAVLLDRLQDPDAQRRANEYAARAADRFGEIVDTALDHVGCGVAAARGGVSPARPPNGPSP